MIVRTNALRRLQQQFRTEFLCAKLMLIALIALTGCVNPNIPSRRLHPHGPLPPAATSAESFELELEHERMLGAPRLPQSFTIEQMADGCGNEAISGTGPHIRGREPEVPWPRFHPLPTRPVY